ncbi:MAG: hypothetical protein HN368_00280, partial [Spirochaetales bacterium]|nr:hypothetical protein [Spirochaetales bacterium]
MRVNDKSARVFTIFAACLLLSIFLSPQVFAQTADAQDADPSASSVDPPTGFSSIRIGMELEEVKDALKRDGQFKFRGDPDVSLL